MSKTNEVDTKGKELFIDINIWDIRVALVLLPFTKLLQKKLF
jgi:hypothetical protein